MTPPTDRKADAANAASGRRTTDFEVTPFGRRRVSARGNWAGRIAWWLTLPFRSLYSLFRHKHSGPAINPEQEKPEPVHPVGRAPGSQ